MDVSTGAISYEARELAIESEQLLLNTNRNLMEVSGMKAALKGAAFPDSVSLSFTKLRVTGFNEDSIVFMHAYRVDTLILEGDRQFVELKDLHATKSNSDSVKSPLPDINIKYLSLHNSILEVRKNNLPIFSTDDFALVLENVAVDHLLSPKPINQFAFGKLTKLSISNYTHMMNEQRHFIRLGNVEWRDSTATMSIGNMLVRPFGFVTGNRYNLDVPSISFVGIDLKRLLYDTYYEGEKIIVTRPKASLFLVEGEQKKLSSLDIGFMPVFLRGKLSGIEFSSLEIHEARVEYHQKTRTDSMQLAIKELDLVIDDFQLDTASILIPERFLFSNDIVLKGQYLSVFYPQKTDFISVNRFGVATASGDIYMDGIYATGNTKSDPEADTWKFKTDRFDMKGFVFAHLTQNKTLRIRDVSFSNPIFQLVGNVRKTRQQVNPSAKTFPLDTALINQLDIGRISITDGSLAVDFTYDDKPKIKVPYLDFMARGVKLSPDKMNDSSRLFYSDEISAKIRSVRYVLPSGLNAISLQSASVSSKDSTIRVTGLKMEPLTRKYEYAPKVGYQSTWLKLENDSITMLGVDFLSIINNKRFISRAVDMDNFRILGFRDKRDRIP
ncbi:MAG: hypothetical protein U5K79_23510 [Cyclobacteriaceae bacterium]|nr:hypothetical protein [Cyclobacteriaceae bacterium]